MQSFMTQIAHKTQFTAQPSKSLSAQDAAQEKHGATHPAQRSIKHCTSHSLHTQRATLQYSQLGCGLLHFDSLSAATLLSGRIALV
jgi:hypothetical protein